MESGLNSTWNGWGLFSLSPLSPYIGSSRVLAQCIPDENMHHSLYIVHIHHSLASHNNREDILSDIIQAVQSNCIIVDDDCVPKLNYLDLVCAQDVTARGEVLWQNFRHISAWVSWTTFPHEGADTAGCVASGRLKRGHNSTPETLSRGIRKAKVTIEYIIMIFMKHHQ